jgi:2-succinyl-5-enolpyruvyl-6-hydroxy-3-cyclohexene-1-carboxylate synthase
MIAPKIPLAQTLIASLQAQKIQHIVISPGSRNAPLTLGFTQNHHFQCYSIVDERCAAFFALGMAQQLQKPVAVVCTSGSALLNYYPAIAEAFYSQIPLLILSADRPADKIDIGDGQTIRQANVFENHILKSLNLEAAVQPNTHKIIQETILLAQFKKGPVHINVPFEEPLYETEEIEEMNLEVIHEIVTQNPKNIASDKSDWHSTWNQASRKLILIGVMMPKSIQQKIIDFWAHDPSVLVMTESTSNIYHPNFIDQIDTLITPLDVLDFQELQPDLLVTMGGMIVSKRIKAFLRKYQPKNHWHVDTLRAYDTFGCLTHAVEQNPDAFFEELMLSQKPVASQYQATFLALKNDRITKQKAFLSKAVFSDLKAFEQILHQIPDDYEVQVGNSSPIRYLQLFPAKMGRNVFCNRGTSGIDGSTTTAIGAAVASQKPTLCITGDISFFYDSNALWNLYIPKNFKIILINNGGGGIFRILPGHEDKPVFNDFFETGHCLTAEHLAKMYGFEYLTASTEATLKTALLQLFEKNEKPMILEVFTPTKINDKVLKEYFRAL